MPELERLSQAAYDILEEHLDEGTFRDESLKKLSGLISLAKVDPTNDNDNYFAGWISRIMSDAYNDLPYTAYGEFVCLFDEIYRDRKTSRYIIRLYDQLPGGKYFCTVFRADHSIITTREYVDYRLQAIDGALQNIPVSNHWPEHLKSLGREMGAIGYVIDPEDRDKKNSHVAFLFLSITDACLAKIKYG